MISYQMAEDVLFSGKSKINRRALWSRIIGSPLDRFVLSNPHEESDLPFVEAVKVFANECREALYVAPIDSDYFFKRYELKRPFIVKVLLYIGVMPNDRSFTVIAKLVDRIVSKPDVPLSDCIKYIAEISGVSIPAMSRIIDKCFNIYDNAVYDRITYITNTKPMTSRDALYDVSMYINAKMLSVINE